MDLFFDECFIERRLWADKRRNQHLELGNLRKHQVPHFFPAVEIDNFVLTNRKKVCPDTAFSLKIPNSLQKSKKRILQNLFAVLLMRHAPAYIAPELWSVFVVKSVDRSPVMSEQSFNEGSVVHETSTDYSIIDWSPQIPYTDLMIEKVVAVNLIDLAPNPGLTSFGPLVTAIVRNAFVFAAIISFILLILGGFQVIVAAGDEKKLEQGKAAITGAVVGLLVVLGSFWIVQIIEVITGLHLLSPSV